MSCGFDSAEGDPIGGLLLTFSAYEYMLSSLLNLKKKIGIVLEGGYSLEVLQWGSESIVKILYSNQ